MPESSDSQLWHDFVHDLKTPLGAIKNFLQIIELRGEFNDDQSHYAERAMGAIDRMERMINDLLDFTRVDSKAMDEIRECDLPQLIDETVLMVEGFATQRGIRIMVDTQPNLARVRGDARLLQHAITNLISNAVKYNHDNGNIWVQLANVGVYVQMQVEDTGVGIAPEALPHIWDRFYRGKTDHIEGSGLGLAIVKSVVQKHGGQVDVTSTPGKGTTFTIHLPRADAPNDGTDNTFTTTEMRAMRRQGLPNPRETARERDDSLDDNLQETQEINEPDSRADLED